MMQDSVNIAVYNRATVQLNTDVPLMVRALQTYVDKMLVPVWGRPAVLTLTDGPVKGSWGMVFMDDADSPGALAYHTVDDGLPLAKVFVRTILSNNETISGGASHELAEMLVDPSCALSVEGPNGTQYAYEVCDPVEENSFLIDGFQMSDFVYPRWFAPLVDDGIQHQYSWCHAVYEPFTLAKGGYASVYQNNNWSQIFGSMHKASMFAREDRRGHRSELRFQTAPKLKL